MPAKQNVTIRGAEADFSVTPISQRIGVITAVACASAVFTLKAVSGVDQGCKACQFSSESDSDVSPSVAPSKKRARTEENFEAAQEFHLLQKKLQALQTSTSEPIADPTLTGREAVKTKLQMLRILITEQRDIDAVQYDRLVREIDEDIKNFRPSNTDFALECAQELADITRSAWAGLYVATDAVPAGKPTGEASEDVMPWSTLKHHHKKPLSATQGFRSRRTQMEYEDYKQTFINTKFQSFKGFIEAKDGLRENLFANVNESQRMVLEENHFPYFVEARIVHRVLWFHPDRMSQDQVDSFLNHSTQESAKQDLKEGDIDLYGMGCPPNDDCIWYENELAARSVPDLRHIQVFQKIVSNYLTVEWAVDR